jgi:hypothetical protein
MLCLGGDMQALHNRLYAFILGPFVLFKIFIPSLVMTPKYAVWF